jgi:3-dehydrosphinganine reductase
MDAIVAAFIYLFGIVIAVRIFLMPLFRRDRLQGKHVMITGGSKGLGLALAREFVKKGCDVSVVARSQSDLLAALQDLVALGKTLPSPPKIQALSADTSSMDDLAKAISVATDAAGPIDVLVCNAGLSIPGLFVNQKISDFERQMEVNYLGTVRTIKCALPTMLARRQGHIVITTSVLSVLGFAGYSSYAPTKWALRGLADCLHNEVTLFL